MIIKDYVYTDGAFHMNYRLAYPESGTEGLPLLIYLHGAGERGDTPDKISHLERHGVPKLLKEGRELPAVVLCPQCPTYAVWDNMVFRVRELIDLVTRDFSIQKDRVVLTGSSMGGYGTFAMALAYPTLFAGIAPISGGNMSWRAPNLKTTPVYAIHGASDTLVPPVCTTLMTDALKKAGGEVKLLLLEGQGHNDAIDYAYRKTDVLDWLLSRRRTDFTPVSEFCSECF